MKARRSTVLNPIFFLLLVGFIVAVATIGHLQYRYSPGVEHESTFLRTYSPRPVIELFAKQNSLSIADGIGSGAGWKFVTNRRKIEPMFAIQTDMSTPLLTALSEDMAAQFTRVGATIISRNGDPASGFHFFYKDGTSVGSVTLLPLSDQARSSLNSPLGERVKEVRANIVISEKWFAQDSDAVQASKELRRS
jgi:hypothetical protein